MKYTFNLSSSIAILVLVITLVQAELVFIEESETSHDDTSIDSFTGKGNHHNIRRKLYRNSQKIYGYFMDDITGLCVELKNGDTKEGNEIWFQTCKPMKNAQLWRFEYENGGKLHTKIDNNKCVQAQEAYEISSRLRIYDCDDKILTQMWDFEGYNFSPSQRNNLIAYTKRQIIGPRIGSYLILVEQGDSKIFDGKSATEITSYIRSLK